MEKSGSKDRITDLEDREILNGHRGAVLWLTGLPASGKSTIARILENRLFGKQVRTFILDGDIIRKGLNADLGFSSADRSENIRRIGEVARLFAQAGMVVIVAFISPYRSDRDQARKIVKDGRFVEIYMDCPVAVCEKRDPKGNYGKARAGQIKEFTGISAPYEPPLHPELVLKTGEHGIDECAQQVIDYLTRKKLIALKGVK